MKGPIKGRYVSFTLRVKKAARGATFEGQVRLVNGRQVGLADGSYQVRVWLDPQGQMVRGTVRRKEDGQTLSFQTGDRVAEFIHACLRQGSPQNLPET